jgi:hypothetical protein
VPASQRADIAVSGISSNVPGKPPEAPGYLKLPLGGIAIGAAALALTCLAALVVVASLKHAETLSTVALALAVVTFVAQLIVFVVQAGAASQQMLQSRALHAEQLQLLGEMGERARGTDATVTRIDERLLEVALGKTLGERDKTGADARSIAMEVTALLNTEADLPGQESIRNMVEILDSDASQRARDRFEKFPAENAESLIPLLEVLSSAARIELVQWAEDEIKYTGTNYPTGLGVSDGPREEILRAGLVRLRRPGAQLYVLTDTGRAAAAVLMARDDPLPPEVAEAVHRLRRSG